MIEQVIKEVPAWQERRISYTPLSGGLTNLNYKVTVDDEAFVVCISGESVSHLGIEREQERIINTAVAKIGIAPQVIHATENGHLVTRFIDGKSFSIEEVCQEQNIKRIVSTIKKIHQVQGIKWAFCPFRIVDSYGEIGKKRGAQFPENFEWMYENLQKIRTATTSRNIRKCLCHNDLLSGNFIDDGNIRIIDWEYAGVGDPFFDLANFSMNHKFTQEHDLVLLDTYFDHSYTQRDVAHLNVMKIVSDFREAMWAVVQTCISSLDEDFVGYGHKHFSRVTERLKSSEFSDMLTVLNK